MNCDEIVYNVICVYIYMYLNFVTYLFIYFYVYVFLTYKIENSHYTKIHIILL